MRKKHLAVALACFLGLLNHALAVTHKERMVIVISLDGFPAYALDDPRLPIPTLRKLAHEGATAISMKPVNPTVTWPNHAAMVTGVTPARHKVVFNGLLTRNPSDGTKKIEPWRDKEIMVHAPTVYDLAYQAGLTTAEVDWVAIYNAKTISWRFPEKPDPKGQIEQELIAAKLVSAEQLTKYDDGSPAWQDQIRTDAAIHILQRYKPNLMLFHITTLDEINHEYGPMGTASMLGLSYLDDRVKQIVDALQSAGLTDRCTLLIVSDHGFRKIDHIIFPNVVVGQANLMKEVNGAKIWDAWVVPEGGSAMVYVTDPARRAELVPRLHTLFSGVEGMDRVFSTSELPGLGLPTSEQSDQAPDLMLAAKPGYSFGADAQGDVVRSAKGGTHGYLNSDPQMQAIFLAWGNGIRPGVHLNRIMNLDVAPTIASLLGVDMNNVTGRPLTQILK